jgi:hypothetical protein
MPKPSLEKQKEARKNFELAHEELDKCRTNHAIEYNDAGPDVMSVYSNNIECVLILRDDGTWGLE